MKKHRESIDSRIISNMGPNPEPWSSRLSMWRRMQWRASLLDRFVR